jgi:SPP1 gp7 family putative phage head morphogenesis protein
MAAELIKPLVGLTDGGAQAVMNLRRRMMQGAGKRIKAGRTIIRVPDSGASEALILKRTQQYAERLLRKRAIAIARTETVTASNEGQRQLWLQAQAAGELEPTALKEWIVTDDDRLCPICAPLEGDVAPINEPYPRSGLMGPPAHIQCRCGQGISNKRGPQ